MTLSPVPILLYHAITPDPPGWIAPFAVSPAVFAAHLDEVAASGRQALTVSQLMDGLRGNAALPPRPVVITVDDGFADFADAALPALAQRGMPSTLYITTAALADADDASALPAAPMLRSADLPGLEPAGVEIGAHSHTHRQLDLLPHHEVAAEVARSRDLLAAALGHPIRSFAYPHGYWRAGVRRLVGEAGFDSAAAVANAASTARDHPLALSRLMVRAGTGPSTVAEWMRGAAPAGRPGRRRVLAFGWRQCRRAQARWHPQQLRRLRAWSA
ncbi:MAG TPA: polysaccharide deacetylase family protein [Streptosporangiaceae bacterium]